MSSALATLSRLASAGGGKDLIHNDLAVHFSLTVDQDKFYLRLKTSKEKYPIVSGFDKNKDDLPGEVEASGRVLAGDFLKSVNGISLHDRPFKQCVAIIRRECQFSAPKELSFFRLQKDGACAKEEHKEGGAKSPFYSAYSKRVLSALKDRTELDMDVAREFSKLGLPDEGGVRSVVWRVLLGYLPPEAEKWEGSLATSRASYQDLLKELILDPRDRENPLPLPQPPRRRRSDTLPLESRCNDGDSDCEKSTGASCNTSSSRPSPPLFATSPRVAVRKECSLLESLLAGAGAGSEIERREEVGARPLRMTGVPPFRVQDHPLDLSPTSAWKKYWDDWLLYESIEKDVTRTHPALHFFAENSSHHEALQRILYLYAMLNPGIKYVQGMNELVGTLYYVLGNQMSFEPWREHVEADTFFCFSLLMIDVRDLFIRNLDEASCGIGGRIQDFVSMLQRHDPEVAAVLDRQGIAPSFYSLRWITTLFTREFDLFDTIRLWDSLFADTDRHELLCCLCCTMVMEQRDELLSGDFTSNLTLLQHYPPIQISHFLSQVDFIRSSHSQRRPSLAPSRLPQDGDWNSASGCSLVEAGERVGVGGCEGGSGGGSVVDQLLTNLQDNSHQWLAEVKQSFFLPKHKHKHSSSHRQRSQRDGDGCAVPDFTQCRNSDLECFANRAHRKASLSSSGVTIPTFGRGHSHDQVHDPKLCEERANLTFSDSGSGDAVDRVNDPLDEGGGIDTEWPDQGVLCESSAPKNGKREPQEEVELFEPMWVFGTPLQ